MEQFYEIIEEAVKKNRDAFEVNKYLEIMDAIRNNKSIKGTESAFLSFYRIRGKDKTWIENYFSVMDNFLAFQKEITIEDVLNNLPHDRIEMSYASKMLATIDDTKPIYDKWVRYALMIGDFDSDYAKSKGWKIDIYKRILNFYENEHNKYFRNQAVSIYDSLVKEEKHRSISRTKKIDYVLWSMGKEGIHAPIAQFS